MKIKTLNVVLAICCSKIGTLKSHIASIQNESKDFKCEFLQLNWFSKNGNELKKDYNL